MRTTILRVLPDFCWQTTMQIVTMLEQIDEDLSVGSVTQILQILSRDGKIEMKKGGLNPAACEQGLGRPRMQVRVRMYKAFIRHAAS